MEKTLIAQRFAKAIPYYDAAATVQRQIAEKMLRLLRQYAPAPFLRIAEFGCGTGLFSRMLLETYMPENFWLNDLCVEVKPLFDSWGTAVHFQAGDAEQIEIPKRQQLITGCSALQWFDEPESFFARCRKSLEPAGYLAFSTFGPETFREMHTLTGQGLNYGTETDYVRMLAPCFQVVHAETEMLQLTFQNPAEVLRHLQQTGVTGTGHFVWTPSRLRNFYQDYQRQFQSDKGVTLTYQAIYVIAKNNFTKNKCDIE